MSLGQTTGTALIDGLTAAAFGGLGFLAARMINRGDSRASADVKQSVDLALLTNRLGRAETDLAHDIETLSARHDRDMAEVKRRLETVERRAESQGNELAILGDRTQQHEEWHREQRRG